MGAKDPYSSEGENGQEINHIDTLNIYEKSDMDQLSAEDGLSSSEHNEENDRTVADIKTDIKEIENEL